MTKIKIKLNYQNYIKALLYVGVFIVASLWFLGSAQKTFAATRTWTGITSNLWSVASNWGGTAPVTGDDLVFPSGASNLSNVNDLTENTIINSITFTGSGYTISGNKFILGAGVAGITDSVSSGGNTLSLDIRLDSTRDFYVTNSTEALTISGRIDGVGGINKEGLGTLILSGSNTYGGTTKINTGVINARTNTALGTIAAGTEVVGGAALELQNSISISYEALTLRGYGVSGGGALRNVGNNNTFGGLITLTSAGGTEISSDSGTLTITGGITGAFPLVFDGAGNITFSTTPIATAAGIVTKNGLGTVTYNFPNTYTGLTTVNAGTLAYGIDNAILSGAVTVTGGTLNIGTFSDMVGTVTLGTLDLANGTITGSTGILSSATWTVYNGTISAIIAGDGGALTKSTSGTVTLTRANQYTGATTISLGVLKIQDSNALGLIDGITTVTAGATLQVDGDGLSIPEYITFSGAGHLYYGAILNSTGNNTLTGLLTMGATAMIKSNIGTTLTVDGKGLLASGVPLYIGGAGDITFTSTAPIYGTTASLIKNDSGVLRIQSFSNYTGATTINRGTLELSSAGALPSSAITVNSGGVFTIDNSSISALNRMSETAAFTMNGGRFNFIGSATNSTSESTGALTLSSGHNIITITPGSGGSTTMTFASLSRTAGATALFRGTNFGSTPAANVSTLMFTTAPTLTGASGSAGTTTVSVIKGVFGDGYLNGNGSDMVTYNVGNTNGVRLLNGAGNSGEYATTLTTNANVKLTADVVASTASINSLILNGFSITNPGSAATLTIASASLSGNVLINSATSISGSNTTIGITTLELDILATANGTISAVVGTAVTGSMTLSGTGNITLSAASAYTGTTTINNATLTYGASNVLSSGGVTVNGGTLDIGANSDTVGAVILQNGVITGGVGILTGTSYSFREGTVSAIIAGAVTVTVVATNAASDAVVTMTRNNTYTGATAISSGILKLGGAGDGTNSPLGTIAAGTTIANVAALDLNGFTLSTAEAITSMNGLGYGFGSTVSAGNSNMGALMNGSGSSVSYSGAITLAAASRINADYGSLTISSAISGAFGLTVGGFSDSTFSGVIGTGTGTITKDGIGVLTLSNSNTYTGVTTISVGTVKLGTAGGATNTPLGTTAGATTVALGARLDLAGFTLGAAEPLTLNGVGYGLGDFASGALINSSIASVTYSGLLTLGSASTIKADSGNISLSNAGTITGATFALTLGGVGTGTVSSIIGTTTGTVTKIDTGTWTLAGVNTYTGATNVNLGTLKYGVNDAAGGGPLGTAAAGTSVFSGAVLDFNGFSTVTLAEVLTINGRGIGNGGAIVNSAGGLKSQLGGVVLGSDSRISISSGTLTFNGGVTGAFALYVGGAGNVTFTTGVLAMGAGSLVKQGAGTVTATGTHTYTGVTRIDAGTFAYGSNVTVLAGTNLTVAGGVFDMAASTDTIGTVTLIDGTIQNGTLTATTSYTFEKGTVSAVLAGTTLPMTKNTNNTLTLTAANTNTGTLTINAGSVVFSGSGSATAITGLTLNLGSTLTLDNSTTAVASRLPDALAVTMNGANFNFIGNTAAASSETAGALTLSSGHNVVTITPGAGGSTTMTFASFARTAGATVLFRGTSLGATPAANVSTLLFTTSTGILTGAAGAANSTTVSVIKGAFGDSSLSGNGSDMVTYNTGNTNGLRLLNGAGFSGEYATNLATLNSNVKLSADAAATTQSINSLILNGFSITNPGTAQTLTLASASLAGNILMNSATNIAGANATIGITTLELDILATANGTVSAVVGTAVAGSLVLSGSGNVTFSAANAYTGTTFINNATLTYGASNVLSSGGVTMVSGTYNLNGNSDTIGALVVNAARIDSGAGTLTFSGSFTSTANNNVTTIVLGNLALGGAGTFNIGNGLMDNDVVISAVISGATTLTKSTGAGVLLLSGSNTYTGLTTVSAGTIRLGATGGATNTPLGTTAAGTTVSGASSALDLNGYTLGTAEPLTLSGALATGALQNTSSTAVTYSGLITLGAASTIISNYGDINISNGGTITGATFGLTIGGAGNGTLSSILGTTSGTLTKNGLGVWTVSGSSTYTGLTTISAGTLRLGSAGGATNTPLGTTGGATSITSGAILDLNGFTLGTAEALTINGTGIASIGALITSSGSATSYSGAITMGAASRVANYGSGEFTITGAISGNFALTTVTVGGITQSSGSVWSGTGALVKEGSGVLTLAGQNSMTGAMTVSTGTLRLGANGGVTNTPLGTIAGGVTVSAGAVLDLSTFTVGGASTWEPLTLNGSGLLNGGALISNSSTGSSFATIAQTNSRIVNNGAGTLTITGAVTGASTFWVGGSGNTAISGALNTAGLLLTKYGSGTLTLSSAVNINTSLVRINAGTLAYAVADALSTPAVTVAGGTLNLNGFNETNIGAITLIDGSIVNTGAAATLTSTATYTLENGTISAALGGTVVAAIAKNTAGRVILSGDNSFSGASATIAVNAGYLNLRHNNALGAAASANTTTISGGATVELENNITIPSVKAFTVNGTGVAKSGAIRNVSGTNTISANITLGSTNVRINSDSGTLTIPTISGNTFNVILGGSGDTTVTGAIGTTSGSVTKDGSGTSTLSGTNTYTGSTTIILGTIAANSSASIGNGSSTNTLIFNGGTLKATGTITSLATRAVSLYGNGTIDTNGNSVSIAGTVGSIGGLTKSGLGTLTLTGVTVIGGDLNISAGTFVAPTSLTLNGNLSNSGTFTHSSGTVTITPTTPSNTISITGSSGITFNNLTNTTPGSTIKFQNGNTYAFSGTLTLTGTETAPIWLSSVSPGSQWNVTLATTALTWVAVQDSNCSGGQSITAGNQTILDQGNNTGSCWLFISRSSGGGGGPSEGGPGAGGNSGGNGGSGNGNSGSGGNVQATATATLQSGAVNNVILGVGGSGYTDIPLVCFSGGSPSVDGVVVAIISGGAVTGFNLISGGSGYGSIPLVIIAAPGTSGGTCGSSVGGGGAGGGGGGAAP